MKSSAERREGRAERLAVREDRPAKAQQAILNLRERRLMVIAQRAAPQGLTGGSVGDHMTALAKELFYLDHAIDSLGQPRRFDHSRMTGSRRRRPRFLDACEVVAERRPDRPFPGAYVGPLRLGHGQCTIKQMNSVLLPIVLASGVVGCGSGTRIATAVHSAVTARPASARTTPAPGGGLNCLTFNDEVSAFNAAAHASNASPTAAHASAAALAATSVSTTLNDVAAGVAGNPVWATLTQAAAAWTGLALAITVHSSTDGIARAEAAVTTADDSLKEICP